MDLLAHGVMAANVRAQAGRAERAQLLTETESRPCLEHVCWAPDSVPRLLVVCVIWVRTFWRFSNLANRILPSSGTNRPLSQIREQLLFAHGCSVGQLLIGGKLNLCAVNHAEVGDATGLGFATAPSYSQCNNGDCNRYAHHAAQRRRSPTRRVWRPL